MKEKQIKARVQHKIGTYADWTQATNFSPMLGEIIIYTTDEQGNNTTAIKIGDGETNVNLLPFVYEEKFQVQFNTWEEND